jgi:PleD family two-component response regulator
MKSSSALKKERSNPRILIIDDDRDSRSLLRDILEKENYEVEEAGNGRIGLRSFRERPADLVITDIFMPECDGLEVIRELKTLSPQSDVIAVSSGAKNILDMLPVAKALGATHTLERSLVSSRLLELVKGILSNQEKPQ